MISYWVPHLEWALAEITYIKFALNLRMKDRLAIKLFLVSGLKFVDKTKNQLATANQK